MLAFVPFRSIPFVNTAPSPILIVVVLSPLPESGSGNAASEDQFHHHFEQARYESAVEKIKEYIVAGDVMQVVLAQRMSIDFDNDPINVYRALRYLNPSPYMVFFDMDDHHVVSASPEILARV